MPDWALMGWMPRENKIARSGKMKNR